MGYVFNFTNLHFDVEMSINEYFTVYEHFVSPEPAETKILFKLASELYGRVPWEEIKPSQSFELTLTDNPGTQACICFDATQGNRGMIVFNDFDDYALFNRPPFARRRQFNEAKGFSCGILSLHPKADISPSLPQLMAKHDWKVTNENAYPLLLRPGIDGMDPLATEHYVWFNVGLAALSGFMDLHGETLARGGFSPLEEYFIYRGIRLRVKYPHPCMFEEVQDNFSYVSPDRKVERNETCPCGSGKKYKNCHMRFEGPARPKLTPTLPFDSEGHELIATTDSFEYDVTRRDEIEKAIARIEHIAKLTSDDMEEQYFVRRPGRPKHGTPYDRYTTFGYLAFRDGVLISHSDSIEHAAEVRRQLETAVADQVRFKNRREQPARAEYFEEVIKSRQSPLGLNN